MQLEKQIETLRQGIILMARKAELIYDVALSALEGRDQRKALQVKELDAELDSMEIKIDEEAMQILALSEPYGVDFRFVFSVIKTTTDLERIGDESKTIAKWARKLDQAPPQEIVELGRKAQQALSAAVQAMITNDVNEAERVMHLEVQVDEIEDKIMESQPILAHAFIAKAMERVGDLATNVAEHVVFSVKAKDIRHGGFQTS